MTPEQIMLVQDNFERLVLMPEQAAAIFYARLFELGPNLRPLFTVRMDEQGRKLMDTLALAVISLDQPTRLAEMLHDLGRRHVAYGVQAQDYVTVTTALTLMLEQMLGEDFTAEARTAWQELFALLTTTMQERVA